jgi:hypothetical protein
MTPDDVEILRAAVKRLPELAASSAAHPPKIDEIFFPLSHAEALDPRRALVVGNRGVGKSFWAGALSEPDVRNSIAQAYAQTTKLHDLAQHQVVVAFPATAGNPYAPDKEILSDVRGIASPEAIWRAVLARTLAGIAEKPLPKTLREVVIWAGTHAEEMQALYREVDATLFKQGKPVLFLFDELDRLADGWAAIQELTQGALRITLGLKQFKSIRAKIFMRPDQGKSRDLFQFQDASKIFGERLTLEWRDTDLYGLFFHHIYNNKEAQDALLRYCKFENFSINPNIAPELSSNPDAQRIVFAALAGEYMGADRRKGSTYTWVPTHLADGSDEVSPRTFLKALKAAADYAPAPSETVFDPNALQDGVRQASETRLAQIGEDYPWVSDALESLKGLLVPCEPSQVHDRWKEANVVTRIVNKYSGSKAPLELEIASLISPDEEVAALARALVEIGVLEIRDNGKYNFPDIFRVHAGIKRKGGVPPHRRRR